MTVNLQVQLTDDEAAELDRARGETSRRELIRLWIAAGCPVGQEPATAPPPRAAKATKASPDASWRDGWPDELADWLELYCQDHDRSLRTVLGRLARWGARTFRQQECRAGSSAEGPPRHAFGEPIVLPGSNGTNGTVKVRCAGCGLRVARPPVTTA